MRWTVASVRLASSVVSGSELADVVGIEPSGTGDKGDLMSPRNPKSQVRAESHAVYSSGLNSECSIREHLHALEPVLRRLANVPEERRPDDMTVRFTISVDWNARAVSLPEAFLKLLAAAAVSAEVWINEPGATRPR